MNIPEIDSLRQVRKSIKYQGRFPDYPDLIRRTTLSAGFQRQPLK